jgi:PAS domain S-box-containing protein
LNTSRVSHEESQGTAFALVNLSNSWLGTAGLALAIGIVYFLASRLGMALHDQPEGLAVISPAAGVATGALIALRSNARLPVAAAVVMGTIACSLIECRLMMGTSPWLAIPLSLANAGQPLITAWLIERWFGGVFKLEDVRQVLGFLVASAIGAAVAAAAATIAIGFFEPTQFPFNVWRLWSASCSLGVITVAPLIIGLGGALREPPPRRELIEGGIALATLAALSAVLVLLPPGPWATALPVALAFPALLWITVRCRPAFAAAATFVVALTVITSTTFNLGHFGDSNVPLADRILAAQTLILAGALLTLILAALFSERRRSEAALQRDITERKRAEQALADVNVQRALAGKAGLVGSYAYDVDHDAESETMQISPGYAAIHGLPEGTTDITRKTWLARIHPEDVARLQVLRDQAFHQQRQDYSIDYRIVRAGEVRWIESRSFISYSSDASPQRVIGVNIDVTDRKRAEERQGVLVAELDHRVKNVLATVSAIITQTQEASGSHVDFVTALNRRINSLARTHELLSESNWRGASLAEIVRREFAPYATGNAEVRGPSVTLKAEATQAVATVLHELTTNAAKYGAFSNRTGRVSVLWRRLQNGSRDRLVIEWQETAGPPVLAPSRSGYGTSIIRELIPFELGGAAELSFAPEGTRCRLEIPGEWANKDKGRAEENRVSD